MDFDKCVNVKQFVGSDFNIDTKVCTRCNNQYPATLEFFYKQIKKSKKRGTFYDLKSECKECTKISTMRWQKENPEQYTILAKRRDSIKNSSPKRIKQLKENAERRRLNGQHKEWIKKNRDKTIMYSSNRRAFNMNLPNTLTDDEIKDYKTFCIGDDSNAQLDHFIPISWGHGGTYVGNIYFLAKEINISKRDKNPIEWMQSKVALKFAPKEQWDILIYMMALTNDLSVTEFTEFINWCEQNKRTVEQIKADGDITSIELWKRSKI